MKSIKLFLTLFIVVFSFQFADAQTLKTKNIKVNGNCGMCKKTIEESAISAGAATAEWNKKSKYLKISYDQTVSNSNKIQAAVANAGYDTEDFKASDDAYNNLEECCQYERKELKAPKKK